mgnify:CR=1 FL=1
MHINPVFELTRIVDGEEFQRLFTRVQKVLDPGDGDEYVDRSLSHKGLTVVYRKSQYKKKLRLIANTTLLMGKGGNGSGRLIHRLRKRIFQYFENQLQLEDFTLTKSTFTADICVGDAAKVDKYINLFHKVGKVKSFSPVRYEGIPKGYSFCLEGKSNGIAFMAYDLYAVLEKNMGTGNKQVLDSTKGVFRIEVRLTSHKAVRGACGEEKVVGQLLHLFEYSKEIFLENCQRIIPCGDYYKKSGAMAIVRKEIHDLKLQRRMLRLIDLIPEKKSLLLAQKALQYRKVDEVMAAFAKLGLSPVTIGKREKVQFVDSLYRYLHGTGFEIGEDS